jgi:hypothetical protein
VLRRFLTGNATTRECVEFCSSLRRHGFGHLISVLLKIGHGHPITFLRYYFAIWDLLLSVFAQASLARYDGADRLAASHGRTVAAAYRQAKRRAIAKDGEFDCWRWMTSYAPATSKLPQLTSDLAGHRVTAIPATARRTHGPASEAQGAMYLALRVTGVDEISAADTAKISTSLAATLETLLGGKDLSALRTRHQAGLSATGAKSEREYLSSDAGWALAEHFASAPPQAIAALAEALTPMRARAFVLPPIPTLRATLVRHATCLPSSLGVLVQFKKGRLSAAETAQIEDAKLRVFVGPSDRDIGERPRLFVVPVNDPLHLVDRPRRTANVRSLLAGLDLMRTHLPRSTT